MRNSALSRNRLFAVLGALVLAAVISLSFAQQSPAGQFDGFEVTHVRKSVKLAPGASARAVAKCPEGFVATGGGARTADDSPVMVEFDAPAGDGHGWEARAEHIDEDDDAASVVVTAVCAKGYMLAAQAAQAR